MLFSEIIDIKSSLKIIEKTYILSYKWNYRCINVFFIEIHKYEPLSFIIVRLLFLIKCSFYKIFIVWAYFKSFRNPSISNNIIDFNNESFLKCKISWSQWKEYDRIDSVHTIRCLKPNLYRSLRFHLMIFIAHKKLEKIVFCIAKYGYF